MQVFKLYFKVLRKYMGIMIMYIGIFVGVLLGVIIPSLVKNETEGYTQSKCDFAVFDYDNSNFSRKLTDYLESVHKLKAIKDDKKETIQDELYVANVDCVIRIKEGFKEAFEAGNGDEYLEVYAIPDTITSVLFEQDLNSYLSVVNTYLKAGFSVEEAVKKAVEAANTSVKVEFAKESKSGEVGPLYYFYKYLSWIFIAMCVTGITPALLSIDRKNVRNRIECSSYKFMRMNIEIVLGVLVTGFVICAVCIAVSLMFFSKEMSGVNAIFYMLNAFCIMAVALAITFFVSKVTDKPDVISLMSNVIALGMAFLCGVFVPMEYLSKTVIKIAHFLPAYWNVKAIEIIDSYEPQKAGTLASYMGIQLLFAVAIICVGMIIARKKRGINA